MAEPKGGLLAIIGGKPGDSEKSEKSGEPSSAKARALKSFKEALDAEKWDEAAEHFQEAYDECAMHSAEDTEEDVYEDDGDDEEL